MSYSDHSGLIVRFVSEVTGDLVGYLDSRTVHGENLFVRAEWRETGGLEQVTIELPKNTRIPLFDGLIANIYWNNEHWFSGYLVYQPTEDNIESSRSLTFNGLAQRMKYITVNETYSSTDVSSILSDLSSYLTLAGISYSAGDVNVPSVSVDDMVFGDTTLYQVIEDLISICNYQYTSETYRWYVNSDLEFCVDKVRDTTAPALQKSWFIGYHFQNPEVDINSSSLVNKILAYRATEADDKESEYVATYGDTGSQGRYGVKESKVTFANFYSTALIQKICQFILAENSEPRTQITVESIIPSSPLERGLYRINNNLDRYRVSTVCDSIDEWDDSGVVTGSVSESTSVVLTGKKSIDFAGAVGESMELVVSPPLPFPIGFRVIGKITGTYGVSVIFQDDMDQDYRIDLDDSFSGWQDIEEETEYSTAFGGLIVTDDSDVDNILEVTDDTDTDFTYLFRMGTGLGIFNIAKIIVTAESGSGHFYLDWLEGIIIAYKTRDLFLKKYTFESGGSWASIKAEFGQEAPTLVSEILSGTEAGKVAFDMFSKQ